MDRTFDAVLETLKNAHDRGTQCSLLIGAGCSVEGGIPTAAGFVERIKVKYPQAYARAGAKTYPQCMAELMLAERRALIAEFVDKAKINWAHVAIARLIQTGYVDRVLTTNFDPLVMRACALMNEFPAVYDFASSQLFSPSEVADRSIFHLHGQRSGFVLMNTEEECGRHANSMAPVFEDAGHRRLWIVVGYSGDNDPVFDHLAKVERFTNGLFWVGYKDHGPSRHLRERLLLAGKDAFYVGGHDADSFFVKLTQQLGLFPPEFLQRPFSYLGNLIDNLPPFRIPDQTTDVDIIAQSRTWIDEARNKYEELSDPSRSASDASSKDLSPESLTARALLMLMADQHDELITLNESLGPSVERPKAFQEAVAWAYISVGGRAIEKIERINVTDSIDRDRLFAEACAKYQAAVAIKPDKHEALNSWGNALLAQAKTKTGAEADRLFAEACAKYQAAVAIKPDLHEALNSWGVALSDQAKTKTGAEADRLFAEAYGKYQAAVAIKPDLHEALNNWGNALLAQANAKSGAEADRLFAEAYGKYQAAVAIKPDKHDALNNWGNALLDQAKTKSGAEADRLFAEAYAKYQAAVAIKPDKHDALNNWGNAQSAQARTKSGAEADRLFAEAYAEYQAAVAIKPDLHDALNNWGAALSAQAITKTGEVASILRSDAEEKFNAANGINAGVASYNLACLKALTGDADACKRWLENSASMGKLPERSHLETDSDLESVRGTEWFKTFIDESF